MLAPNAYKRRISHTTGKHYSDYNPQPSSNPSNARGSTIIVLTAPKMVALIILIILLKACLAIIPILVILIERTKLVEFVFFYGQANSKNYSAWLSIKMPVPHISRCNACACFSQINFSFTNFSPFFASCSLKSLS